MSATTANNASARGQLLPSGRVLATFGLIALVVLLIGGYAGDWSWTGFSENDTLWDWLQLLLLPIAIATLPIWVSHREFMDPRVRRTIIWALLAFVALVLLGYLVPWEWTGFTGNTLWDWLGLILLPVVLTTVRLWEDIRPRVLKRHLAATTVLFWSLVALVCSVTCVPGSGRASPATRCGIGCTSSWCRCSFR